MNSIEILGGFIRINTETPAEAEKRKQDRLSDARIAFDNSLVFRTHDHRVDPGGEKAQGRAANVLSSAQRDVDQGPSFRRSADLFPGMIGQISVHLPDLRPSNSVQAQNQTAQVPPPLHH